MKAVTLNINCCTQTNKKHQTLPSTKCFCQFCIMNSITITLTHFNVVAMQFGHGWLAICQVGLFLQQLRNLWHHQQILSAYLLSEVLRMCL